MITRTASEGEVFLTTSARSLFRFACVPLAIFFHIVYNTALRGFVKRLTDFPRGFRLPHTLLSSPYGTLTLRGSDGKENMT